MAQAASQIDLIAGLGNPGPDYSETRHNAGFWLLDRVVEKQNKSFTNESRFHGEACNVDLAGRVVRLIKPTTFMNRSGQSVAAIARYFKIPVENVLVVHDELDIPPGDARIKFAGGHGGHNGLRDLISHFGSPNFWRIRVGIGHPGSQAQVVNYVLKPPSRDDAHLIDDAIQSVIDVLPLIANGEMQKATNSVHSRRPKSSEKKN